MKRVIIILLLVFSVGLFASTTDRVKVRITNPADNDVLIYDESDQRFENAPQDSLSTSCFPLENDESVSWDNNAGDGIINGIKINTLDQLDIGQELFCSNTFWGDDPGLVVTNYITVGTNTDLMY